jgi:hypothetical protein
MNRGWSLSTPYEIKISYKLERRQKKIPYYEHKDAIGQMLFLSVSTHPLILIPELQPGHIHPIQHFYFSVKDNSLTTQTNGSVCNCCFVIWVTNKTRNPDLIMFINSFSKVCSRWSESYTSMMAEHFQMI